MTEKRSTLTRTLTYLIQFQHHVCEFFVVIQKFAELNHRVRVEIVGKIGHFELVLLRFSTRPCDSWLLLSVQEVEKIQAPWCLHVKSEKQLLPVGSGMTSHG